AAIAAGETPETEAPAPVNQAGQPVAAPEDAGASVEDVDDELVELFLAEGQELLENLELTLHRWSEEPRDRALAEAVKRDLHTLKGAARMAGQADLGSLIHDFESRVGDAEGAVLAGDAGAAAELLSGLDAIAARFEAVQRQAAGTPGRGAEAPTAVAPQA